MNETGNNGSSPESLPLTPEEKRAAMIRIAKRRSQVADLILQRVPKRQICARLNISKRTFERDQAALKEEWSRTAGERIDLHVGTELEALNADEFAVRVSMSKETDERAKLKYLDRILEIGKERRKLLGLDAATKVGIRFEGSLDASVEVRDPKFYEAMLSNPDTRALALERYRKAAGLPTSVDPSTNGHAKNGHASKA